MFSSIEFECVNKRPEGSLKKPLLFVNTCMYKPLPLNLKAKEIQSVEPQCHTKDIERATSLPCTSIKNINTITKQEMR